MRPALEQRQRASEERLSGLLVPVRTCISSVAVVLLILLASGAVWTLCRALWG